MTVTDKLSGTGDESGAGGGSEEAVAFLSDEWLAAASAALASLEPLPDPVSVGYQVVRADGQRRDHRVSLGPGRVSMTAGLDGASVVMTLDWDLAVAISQGRAGAKQAVLDGRIALAGDPAALLGHQRRLAEIDDRLAELRRRTSYTDPPGPD